jgi:tRNA threonylcarbamoyladenosine biosynthesis protein TsaB
MWLALDASTYRGSVAVLDGGQVVSANEVAMRGTTEERLMPAVVDAVAVAGGWGGIRAVFVGGGPGSFTSLRIAAAIAKGVATARGLPLWTGSSLALAAADPTLGPGRFLVALDAMRGDVYVEGFVRTVAGSLGVHGPSSRIPRDAAIAQARAWDAVLIVLPDPESAVARPHAMVCGALMAAGLATQVDVATWEPAYGRLAEAQVVWEARHGRPLPGGTA